ncbi:MAG TPA: hypothetical protein VHW43_07975 [Puia sp.]|nr:hypothetical protein [Puia sp.]
MATKAASLATRITRLLDTEFGRSGTVTSPDDQLTIVISKKDCNENFGNVVRQIYQVIEEHCPERGEHVFILIRDENGSFKNLLKVWKPDGNK